MNFLGNRNALRTLGAGLALIVVSLCLFTNCSHHTISEPNPSGNYPAGILIQSSGCKDFLAQSRQIAESQRDCVEFQYDGNRLFLSHINTAFNCCPDSVSANIAIQGNTIIIQEIERIEHGGCHCLCLFDLEYKIEGLPVGAYQIQLSQLYLSASDELLHFTINLSSSPTGRYCAARNHYPWGL